MATREQQRRVNAMVALFLLSFGGLMVFSLIYIAISEGLLVPKSTIAADFRDVGSIGEGSEVQLAGTLIGKVVEVQFVTERYACNPETEDFGRNARSDDCEPWMFCAQTGEDPSVGSCAELEEFSGYDSDYEGCQGPGTCEAAEHVCVTRSFRQRYRGVRWWGQAGWCVRYDVDSQRIRVSMEVDEDSLESMREDSRASIVLNGPLSSPRVNVSVGSQGAYIQDGDRLQTASSLIEDALALKEEIDRIAVEVERGLIGLTALTDALSDEKAKLDIDGIAENVAAIKSQLRGAQGLIGAVLNDPDTRSDLSKTLRDVRREVGDAQAEYATLERRVKRTLRDVERAADGVETLVDGVLDPQKTSLASVLTNEEHGLERAGNRLAENTEEAIGSGREAIADVDAALAEVMRSLEARQGTLGRLFYDPKPLYHLKSPAAMSRVNTVKRLVRWVTMDEAGHAREPEDEKEGEESAGAGESEKENAESDEDSSDSAAPATERAAGE
ncbi:hypothetical protein G6O69_28675 [Pseudenhygromyxa sp. WMMC2535]|uniref:MlaD family protein n=1 Tax=Pseudenhygromyxa sp. WMMC2535 TaxID=2712867 RepID=UPI001556CE64|nr:hypothetical protein [Pseudenhygromyxa sp. WMMC2535]NVB41841.1 hypothetical protein [Pseudenhygromyxa sp. WMMC2535]